MRGKTRKNVGKGYRERERASGHCWNVLQQQGLGEQWCQIYGNIGVYRFSEEDSEK